MRIRKVVCKNEVRIISPEGKDKIVKTRNESRKSNFITLLNFLKIEMSVLPLMQTGIFSRGRAPTNLPRTLGYDPSSRRPLHSTILTIDHNGHFRHQENGTLLLVLFAFD